MAMAKYEYMFVRVEGKKGIFTINVADSAEYHKLPEQQDNQLPNCTFLDPKPSELQKTICCLGQLEL